MSWIGRDEVVQDTIYLLGISCINWVWEFRG